MMTQQIDSDATKLMNFVQLRPQQSGELIRFTYGDSTLPAPEPSSLCENGLTADDKRGIQEELRRLLQSPLLIQSKRLSRFLSFAVETTLKGNGDALKEYTIGIEAYGRRQDFDPRQDSIVRTEARRLRAKLEKHYQDVGQDDPVIISFRPGSYVPLFRSNGTTKRRSPEIQQDARPQGSPGISISVNPFTHISGDAFGEACARGLTDEFMHCLTQTEGLRVFASSTEARMEHNHEGWIISEGCVRTEGSRIRVTSRLYEADGLHIASWRFDARPNPDELFGTLEKIALEIVTCMDCHTTPRNIVITPRLAKSGNPMPRRVRCSP